MRLRLYACGGGDAPRPRPSPISPTFQFSCVLLNFCFQLICAARKVFESSVIPIANQRSRSPLEMMNTTRVGWVAEPDGRGTAGLVYSCLFTIFLSTWTAYHPDVKSTQAKAFWDKVVSTAIFIFAPECLVWVAMNDWRHAKHTQLRYFDSIIGVCQVKPHEVLVAKSFPRKLVKLPPRTRTSKLGYLLSQSFLWSMPIAW